MRRTTQQQPEPYDIGGIQGAFNFDVESATSATTVGSRQSKATPSSTAPRKRATRPAETHRRAAETHTSKQLGEAAVEQASRVEQKSSGPQNAPASIRRGVKKPKQSEQHEGVDAAVAPAPPQRRRARMQPSVVVEVATEVKASEPTAQPRPRVRKEKGSKSVENAAEQQTPVAAAPELPIAQIPAEASMGPEQSSDMLAMPEPPALEQATLTYGPPTWRFQGTREDADRMYQRRFQTDAVPEPTMVTGTWAYALPSARR